MKIITSLRVKSEKQQELKSRFLNDKFHFFKNITEAYVDLKDADILVTYGEDLTPEFIHHAKSLKWIMVMSAGIDRMPLQEIKIRGILVTNARGIHKVPMAEYTLGMMLQVSKQFKSLNAQEKEGKWNRALPTTELYKKTILIFGVGAIGGQIAKLCHALDMKVIGINRSGKSTMHIDKMGTMGTLEQFLPHADFVVSVLPSTNETKYILTKHHFEIMKDTAVFINVGRGDVARESVLIEVMKERQIAHAVLDVFEQEPLPSGHLFWEMDNVTVTPHISSITSNYLPRAFEIFEENLHIYKSRGTKYVNQIDINRGY